ncbi:uncharacterized protein LOC133178539 [Saccostrea echinata]|uniref:uncharacterized protein LOC133178539 n=1 Tax=Saccostrea echinata TaxID=191078 RepID=UPI002A7EB69C|nr:uncharacterized protein LOC133178539 [Saccostrea echinata]
MASDSASATDSVVYVPDTISVSYLDRSKDLSQKVLEKGLNCFTQGCIHNIRVSKPENRIRVDANCWRSKRKSQPPYSLQIEINVEKSTLTESYCKCKVGLGILNAMSLSTV